jgi:hypothetical protein
MERLRMRSYLPSDSDGEEQVVGQPPVDPRTAAQRRLFMMQLQQVQGPNFLDWLPPDHGWF